MSAAALGAGENPRAVAMHFQVSGDNIVKFRLYEDSYQVATAYAE